MAAKSPPIRATATPIAGPSSPPLSLISLPASGPPSPDASSLTRDQLMALVEEQRNQLHQRQAQIERLMIEHASLRLAERRSRSSAQLQDTLNTSKRKSLEEITTSVLTLVRNALEAERVAIYFVSKDACWGIEPEDPLNYDDFRAHRFQVGSYVGGMVAANGRSIKIDDVGNDPRFDASWSRRSKARCECTMACAVRDHDGTVLAVIQALNKRPAPSPILLVSSPLSSPSSGPSLPSIPLLSSSSPSSSSTSSLSSSLPTSASNGNISAADYKLNVAPLAPVATINSTSKPGETWHIFTQDDVDLLELMCMQLRSTMRRYLPYALLDYLSSTTISAAAGPTVAAVTSGETGVRLRSFIDTYNTESTLLKTRSMSDASRGRGLSFQWPVSSTGQRFNVEQLSSLTFNVWEYSDNDLVTLTWRIFQDMGFVEEFHIPPASLQSFALSVCKRYRANPFHNWKHGFSVLQFTYLILRKTNASQLLLPEDVFSLIVSSLCHDVDHPGHNNTYEMATSSPLALTHNDMAVLENHHAHTTFLILRSDRCQLLSGMTAAQQKSVRACMIKAILATDMSTHFDEMKKIDAWPVPQSERDKPLIDQKSDKERQFLVNTLIHSADLSGQVYPNGIARVWEDRITQEFINQVDLEAKHGLPSMPFMQGLDKPMNRAKQQVSFIEFVLQPWWRSVARMFPQLERCYKQLLVNRDHFAAIAKGEAPYEPPVDFYKIKKEADAKAAGTAPSAAGGTGGNRTSPHGRSPSAPHLLVDTYRVGGSDTGAPPINSSPRDGSGHFSASSTASTPRGSGNSINGGSGSGSGGSPADSLILSRPASGSDALAIRTDDSSPSSSRLSGNGPSPSLASSLPALRPSSSSINGSLPNASPTNMGSGSNPATPLHTNAAGAPPSPLGLPGAAAAADVAVSTAALISMAAGHRPVLRGGESGHGSGSAPATPNLGAVTSLSPPPPKPRTASLGTSSPHSSTVTLTVDHNNNGIIGTDNNTPTPPSSSSTTSTTSGGGSPLQHTWTIHRKAPKTPGSGLTSPTLPPLAENNEMAKRSGSTSSSSVSSGSTSSSSSSINTTSSNRKSAT